MALISWIKQQAGIANARLRQLQSGQLDPASLRSEVLQNLSVTTAKINDLAVTTAKIGSLAVTTAKIDSLAVTDAKIDTLSVTKLTAGDLSVVGTLVSGGKLVTGVSPNSRIEIAPTEITGYSDATTKQFYLSATDGKAYAGGGNVALDAAGLTTTGQLMIFKKGSDIRGYVFAHTSLDEMDIYGIGADIYLLPGTNKVVKIYSLDTTPADVSSSRAIGTIYQNTGGKPLIVAITIGYGATGRARFDIGSANPPTTVVGLVGDIGHLNTTTFVVPVNYYYRVVQTAASTTLQYWIETNIG